MSFDTIFWDDILGRYFGMILRCFGMKIKVNKLLIGPKQVISSVKNHNKFSSQNIFSMRLLCVLVEFEFSDVNMTEK